MQFKKALKLGSLSILLAITLTNQCVFADEKINEFDIIRAELSCLKDKNSPYYIKTKQKLDKLLAKNKIDYSDEARFNDIERLINEQKFASAFYELNELIEKGYKTSACYELLGDISQKKGEAQKVIVKYYKNAAQEDSNNISARYKIAKIYLTQKKNIIAVEFLKEIVEKTNDCELLEEIKEIITTKIMPQNKYEANNLYEILGEINLKLGQKEEAFSALSKAIQINPKDIFLKYYLSGLLYENNEYDHALALYDSILYENSKDNQIKTLKAKTLIKQGKFLEAQEIYQQILNDFPLSSQAKYGIYEIYKNSLNPSEILKKVYQQNKNYSPSTKDIYKFADFLKEMEDINGAQIFITYAQDIEEAKKQKILQEEQQKQKELIKKEEIKKETTPKQTEQKKPEMAQKKEKKELKPKKEIEKNITKKEEKKPQIAKKEEIKKEIKENKPKQQQPKQKLENTLDIKKAKAEKEKAISKNPQKYQELEAIAKKYLALEPKTAQNYIAAANTYKQLGELTTALYYYKEAMKLDPTNSDIYYNIGLTSFEQNNTKDAKTNLEKSINLDSENTKAKNLLSFVNQKIITHSINKAYALYEKKNYIPAFEVLDNEIKNYPQNAQLYYYRALIYSAMDRNGAAIIDLQKSIELDASHYMSYYQLGNTYEKINDERSALVAYEKFLSTEPEEKELVDEIQKKVINLGAKYY
ncbi:MAG: tetratricopeptide repeat protein [Candidatus Gastranaerophilales bacterium]|nr:tetratricopeptide repeat protein [Candidatus Gastranaerophilales bacterium]